jgi:hypothetical protein
MHGSFALLAWSPLWLTFLVLEFICLGMVLIIRKITEGRAYNPAYSSFIGIHLLIAIVLAAAYTLRHTAPMGLEASVQIQWIVGGFAVIYAAWRQYIPENPADRYHQTFVIPIFIWFLVPATLFLSRQGDLQTFLLLALFTVFAGLVLVDNTTGRSKPRQYMLSHGAVLKGSYPPGV